MKLRNRRLLGHGMFLIGAGIGLVVLIYEQNGDWLGGMLVGIAAANSWWNNAKEVRS